MKALYIKGTAPLSDELRAKYRGHRIENADVFDGVARGVDEAEVIGDYPDIVKALKAAKIPVVGDKPKAKKSKPVETKSAPVPSPESTSESTPMTEPEKVAPQLDVDG